MRRSSQGLVVVVFALLAWVRSAKAAPAAPDDDPLRRNYVDLAIQGGASWLGSVGDGRWSPIGPGFGTRLSVGRAPYWGCVYVDVAFYSPRDGVVDPVSNVRPNLTTTSAGWCAKMAIRLAPRLYLFPMAGAGFGVLDYQAGLSNRYTVADIRVIGLGVQAEATLVYRWRFGALTLQPIRTTAYLFEHLTGYNFASVSGIGPALGLRRYGLSLGASIGFSVDLSAIGLAIYESVHDVASQVGSALGS